MTYDELPKPEPATEPIFLCPFTHALVRPVYSETRMQWQMQGGYGSMPWYDRKETCIYDYSTRMGVAPAFPSVFVTVVGEVTKPEVPKETAPLSDAGQETIEKIAKKLKRK